MSNKEIITIATEMGTWMGEIPENHKDIKGRTSFDFLNGNFGMGNEKQNITLCPCLRVMSRGNPKTGEMESGLTEPIFGSTKTITFQAKRILTFAVVDDENILESFENAINPKPTQIILPGKKGISNV